MNDLPARHTGRLHAGRLSAEGAAYFVTFVTRSREPWLAGPVAAEAMLAVLRTWHHENAGLILAASVLPDHVHVLVELGPRTEVGRIVARWKSLAARAAGWPGEWQRDFWEHRVRTDESVEPFGLYTFLNPYRHGLVRWNESWPWSWVPDSGCFQFTAALSPRGVPPAEWSGWPEDHFKDLPIGE